MAKFFPVSPAIWDKRLIDLGRDRCLLYAYLLSAPHRASEGLYRLPKAYAAADLGFDLREVNDGLADLENAGLILYDHGAEVVLLPDALRYQAPRAKNQVRGAIVKLEQVPDTLLLAEFIKRARIYCSPDPEKDIEGIHPLVAQLETHWPREASLAEQLTNTWPTHSEDSPTTTLRSRQLGGGSVESESESREEKSLLVPFSRTRNQYER
ncbi:MAG: hypothetical protein ABR529_03455 [Actinomycetota bacterium]